ncbi:MAG: M42 family peptidase [Desulfobacteraceae bacterium]|nr:MAG: M42 family peptidase [Desulfobacteraceae bacterium]
MKELIKKLTEAYGPSGYEQQIRKLIQTEIAGLADKITVNRLGSLIAFRPGTAGGARKKIMLAAHMDEIGVMVTHVDKNGFSRFAPIGGINPIALMGGRVVFENATVGVIGVENREDRGKAPTLEQLYIDVGAKDPASCKVKVGDAAGFTRPFEDLGVRLVAKSMDDRIGCVILIETLRRLKKSPHDIYFVFSVQEEMTGAGAQTSAYELAPDMALAVDVTGIGDTPEAVKMAVALGKGPAVKVKDSGMLAHRGVKELMIERAQEQRIPYQLEVLVGGSTDARHIQLTRAGVPSGCLSVPCRYIHTPSEMVDFDDVQNGIKLLLAILAKPIAI